MHIKNKYYLLLFSIVLSFSSCCHNSVNQIKNENVNPTLIEEAEVKILPLRGEISKKNSEISGLCWYGDKLILLPQYPDGFDADLGKLFFIRRDVISNYINEIDTSAILPDYFSIDLTNFKEHFSLGSGFESVTFNNHIAYFTIESMNEGKTETILVKGKIDSINNNITLDENSLVKDPTEMFIYNISDESILYYNNQIIPIYEIFGKNLNSNPTVSVFNRDLKFIKKIDFPHIEYRITDVTSVDESGKFWAINYFYPGDNKKLNPAVDPFMKNYGIGKSHFNSDAIERLVEFQILEDQIILVNQSPIYLELMENMSRNWEGIARFNKDGFLIVTDTFPETILAFVKTPLQ